MEIALRIGIEFVLKAPRQRFRATVVRRTAIVSEDFRIATLHFPLIHDYGHNLYLTFLTLRLHLEPTSVVFLIL